MRPEKISCYDNLHVFVQRFNPFRRASRLRRVQHCRLQLRHFDQLQRGSLLQMELYVRRMRNKILQLHNVPEFLHQLRLHMDFDEHDDFFHHCGVDQFDDVDQHDDDNPELPYM
jgi:hypothetical protein